VTLSTVFTSKKILPPLEQQVKYEFVRYTRGIGVDLGYGKERVFEHSVGLRPRGDIGDVVPNVGVDSLYAIDSVKDVSCDFVVTADVLPRCDDGPAAVKDWLRVLKVGGHLCMYEPKGNKQALLATAEAVCYNIDIVALESWGEGAYMVLQKTNDGQVMHFSYVAPRPQKTVLVVRHGGIGDQLQAAYLLPQLKREGFHITFLTTPEGREIIEHDPHVDEWFMVDKEQVPNNELVPFWSVVLKHYDKFVNLNESCEGSLLTMPGRPAHQWPHAVRHKLMNRNYAEFAALLGEIPFVPEGEFHSTPAEATWATLFKAECARTAELDDPFFLMWVLAGSSPHKFTPHQDTVLKIVMGSIPEAVVIMVGALSGKILEAGWELEKRVVRTSGEMPIRKSLALAKQMDIVVGPETGVLNSVCYLNLPKVLMLSHSSDENLSKHWVNVHVIPGQAPCYPCHRLHFTSEYCPQDPETHAAVCQQNVDPRLIYAPIEQEYHGWLRGRMVRAA
jgi:ADP-heptose:LPS heptosyltransferase